MDIRWKEMFDELKNLANTFLSKDYINQIQTLNENVLSDKESEINKEKNKILVEIEKFTEFLSNYY